MHPAGARTEPPPVHKYFWLAVVLIFAGGLRLLVIRFSPHLVWPDEIFQVQEPAHRLVYGSGITAWEFVLGIRSWLLPGIVAGLMTLAKLHGDDPLTSTLLVTLFVTLCSLAPVLCAYLWGYRFGGLGGAVIGGGFAAVWIDLVYFSTHPLTEVIAGQSLAMALYLGYPGDRVASRAPAVLGRGHVRLDLRVPLPSGPGPRRCRCLDRRPGLAARLAAALGRRAECQCCSSAFWTPQPWACRFQSVWLNTWINLVHGVSEDWGTAPWYMAIAYQLSLWGSASVLIAVAALFGATRLPLLLAVAATVGVVYAAVPHKEYRFVYPALPFAGRSGRDRHRARRSVATAPARLTACPVSGRAARSRLLERRVGDHGRHPILPGAV